jgi:hypothetical protein
MFGRKLQARGGTSEGRRGVARCIQIVLRLSASRAIVIQNLYPPKNRVIVRLGGNCSLVRPKFRTPVRRFFRYFGAIFADRIVRQSRPTLHFIGRTRGEWQYSTS